MRALLPLLVALMATNCTPTPSATSQKSASANPALDAATLLYGDAALKSQFKKALAAKGKKYEPRTKHKRADGTPTFTNRLILETSPYLAQHAHNPVNWFPWGDEAFEVARKLGRPVFLSVGYSTCHWCHVMEEESFEDEAIAKYLNDHYVMIKVDREERPDVDAIYMRAVQILTRRGGWPMSVWLTAEGKPFYGGTYFPARDGDRGTRKGFITILKEQYDSFKRDPAGIASDSAQLAARVQEDLKPTPSSGLPGAVSLQMAVEMAGRRFDPEYGGSRGKPKFPSSFPVRTLLRYGRRAKDDNATTMALTSLSKMAAGGMYDHVAGGFHRYSTDARWLVPHFEKMLYDNALLAIAYMEGYQASGDADLLRVAREILDYVVRDMTSPEGGYYSATDADSIGPKGHREEGYYFTWTPSELEQTLGAERAATVAPYYAVKPGGNFEGRSILHTPRDKALVAKQLKITVAELEADIAAARPLLLKERNKRPAPIRDEKIQVSWNGLMLAAMARGARVLGDQRYRDNAKAAARFILEKLYDGGRLKHSYMAGRTTTVAFAEDHAFFAGGLLELFEATHEPEWLGHAVRAMEQLEKLHTRGTAGGYFRTAHDAEKLLAREMQQRDGAVPAASSIALMNHLKLSSLTTDDRWRKRAEKTLSAFSTILSRSPWALEDMLVGLDYYTDTAKEVLLVLPEGSDTSSADYRALEEVLKRHFVPNHVLVVSTEGQEKQLVKHVPWAKGKPPRNDKPTAYVCERGACELPTNDPGTLRRQLDKFADFSMGVVQR